MYSFTLCINIQYTTSIYIVYFSIELKTLGIKVRKLYISRGFSEVIKRL